MRFLIFSLICSLGILTATSNSSAEPRRLNHEKIIDFTNGGPFSGTTVKGSNFSVTFNKNGTINGVSDSATDDGTWEVVDDTLCVQWRNWRYQERLCFYYIDNENGTYSSFFVDGTPSSVFEGKMGSMQ